ncbi:MAG: DNA repair protein RadA, partial [Pseudomonadota bacterium]|nr:DNA repair protein RadA [Pseudomonadota bacterium]
MAKSKSSSAYVCNECGSDFTKWQGQCSDCGAWNSLSEVRLGPTPSNRNERFDGYAGAL